MKRDRHRYVIKWRYECHCEQNCAPAVGVVMCPAMDWVTACQVAASMHAERPQVEYVIEPLTRKLIASVQQQLGPAVADVLADKVPFVEVPANSTIQVTATAAGLAFQIIPPMSLPKATTVGECVAQAVVEEQLAKEVYAAAASPWFYLSRPYHRMCRFLRWLCSLVLPRNTEN